MKPDAQKPEAEVIRLTDFHQAVGDTVSRCHYAQIPIILTKRGNPVVALIPLIGTLGEHTNLRELVAKTLGLPFQYMEAGEERTAKE